jgi:transposase InsO family protein
VTRIDWLPRACAASCAGSIIAQDVVQRHIYAERPNQRWVADCMYVATWRGVVSVAFVIGLFKPEVIHRDGPWCGFEDAAMATLRWVAWFIEERGLAPQGSVPPAEFEAQY